MTRDSGRWVGAESEVGRRKWMARWMSLVLVVLGVAACGEPADETWEAESAQGVGDFAKIGDASPAQQLMLLLIGGHAGPSPDPMAGVNGKSRESSPDPMPGVNGKCRCSSPDPMPGKARGEEKNGNH